jgi:DNA-binding NarL/FixJ family response regulator
MIKVCIADNHPVILHGIKSFFNESHSIDVIATANSLSSLQNSLLNKTIDVIVVDIELDGISSIRDIKTLMKDYPESKIVLFQIRK